MTGVQTCALPICREFNDPRNPGISNIFGGKAKIYDATAPVMIYNMGSKSVKTLKPAGVSDTSFIFKRTTSKGSVDAAGIFTLSSSTNSPVEKFPYGTTTALTTDQKKEITVVCESNFDAAVCSTFRATTTLGGYTVTGSFTDGGAAFPGGFNNFNVGDKLSFSGVTGTYIIASIDSATQVTLTSPCAGASNAAFYKRFETGDIIDLNSKGTTGASPGTIRSVETVTPTSLTVKLNENFGSARSMSFSYRVSRSTSDEIKKILKPNAYVKIDCSSNQKGPFNLGFADVYKIKGIYKAKIGRAHV